MLMRVQHVDAGAVCIGRVDAGAVCIGRIDGNGFGAGPGGMPSLAVSEREHLRRGDHGLHGIRTTTEAVDLALRHLACQPLTREEALAMRGANVIDHAPADAAPIRPV
jgi:hypothetical protein